MTQKHSARERLRAQRAREKSAEKRRRTLKVGAAVVGVLVVAGVVGVVVAEQNKDSGGSGSDAKPITVGKAGAPAKLTVYEDFRCPACAQFENQYRDTVHALERAGKLRTEYHLVTLIDGNLGGSGSKKAANAAACARDEGKFSAYHDVLYQNQPEEQDDAFGSEQRLLSLAKKVKGLDGASFRKCVNSGEHESWVTESNDAFRNSDHDATPTILLDGENIYSDQSNPLTPAKLKKKVEQKAG
ncbi:DsbA family protein [Streptomyces boncukensis]|uniref:Thioredoxin domain-containing protein n=1 Tax=Streptomyces boncukensis TaxID=2711219 RepID=A0A6G4WZ42_9ACTN|nr:thioredoxin domain-containing protein [Streptomyces boncukensis]NGO70388.1 thioredoxin domain-containing protein [Streptomyces boncukensis]